MQEIAEQRSNLRCRRLVMSLGAGYVAPSLAQSPLTPTSPGSFSSALNHNYDLHHWPLLPDNVSVSCPSDILSITPNIASSVHDGWPGTTSCIPHQTCPTTVSDRCDRTWGKHVVLCERARQPRIILCCADIDTADVPGEERRSGAARMEAPLGPWRPLSN